LSTIRKEWLHDPEYYFRDAEGPDLHRDGPDGRHGWMQESGMSDLTGKRVLVVGGSSGIGLATAQAAAKLGASVVVASRSQDRLDAAVAAIGPGSEGRVLDTTSDASVEAFFADGAAYDHVVISAAQTKVAPTVRLKKTSSSRTVKAGSEVTYYLKATNPAYNSGGGYTPVILLFSFLIGFQVGAYPISLPLPLASTPLRPKDHYSTIQTRSPITHKHHRSGCVDDFRRSCRGPAGPTTAQPWSV